MARLKNLSGLHYTPHRQRSVAVPPEVRARAFEILKRTQSIDAACKLVKVSRLAFEELLAQKGFVTPILLERVLTRFAELALDNP